MIQFKTDLKASIVKPDVDLNVDIQAYLDGEFYHGESTTVAQWRLDNYEDLRRWAYPDPMDLNDATVKINSGISELISIGNQQLQDYAAACLAVKIRFPEE